MTDTGATEPGAGWFVVIEGGEGSGKSTQVALLGERFRAFGRETVVTREPGGTDRGAQIRELLLHDHARVDVRAELLLMLADRAQHVADVIRPALARGAVVVSDRFAPSTLVYQGIGRELGVETVERMSEWATGGLEPNLVVVLDVDDETAALRMTGAPDRLEDAGAEFHRSVREGYRLLAPMYGWAVIDGGGLIDDVSDDVWVAVRHILP